MITGFLKLCKGIWDFLGMCLAGIGKWLAAEHNWWRITCFAFGTLCIFAAFSAYDARQTIVLVQIKADAEKASHVLVVNGLYRTISERDRALAQVERSLQAEARKLAKIMRENANLQQEVTQKTAAADKSAAAYLRESAKKPDVCAAALKVLAQSCPTLKGY